ncbi:MAG: YggS family pyridoxal phosphate-dependent enzyme [Acidobacteria bacterium]|nr:MAG: YggS family pyridoxal phosphate-dependent enzyme [Acidobacteriota bacterium]RPJ84288.1 MAG: YggS family pyridoxal phosphate-dependent enzyme [Acidobacteriota bacterium]
MTSETELAARLADVRCRIARAAGRSGRAPDAVRLVAVSKTYPAEQVRAAVEAGQRDFGENRVQEALQKVESCRDLGVRWHLIGHLQSNKARKAASAFGCIHSIDRLELLDAVDRAAAEARTSPELLVQVDLAGESTKHGAATGELRAQVAAAAGCRAARLAGLMILPPFLEDPEQVRPYFRQLRELRDGLVADGLVPAAMMRELSMGMSHDFEVAVEEGATMVRVGTAIFGSRGTHA